MDYDRKCWNTTKILKICLDTSIYTEFHAGVDSDGQNPSKICQKSQNHTEITKFRFDRHASQYLFTEISEIAVPT